MPGAASRLDAELMSKVLSANRTLTRRARPPTAADQVQTAALQFRRLSNCDATARPHRSPSPLRNTSTRWYSPARLAFGSHGRVPQRLPYPQTNSPWAVPLKPDLGRPRPTERAAITLLRRDASGSRPSGAAPQTPSPSHLRRSSGVALSLLSPPIWNSPHILRRGARARKLNGGRIRETRPTVRGSKSCGLVVAASPHFHQEVGPIAGSVHRTRRHA